MPESSACSSRSQKAALLGMAVAVLGFVGCGQTRYVVVENQAAGAPAGQASAPAVAASADEDAAIRDALEGALGLDDRGYDERVEFLHEADDVEPTYEVVRDLVEELDVQLRIDGITVEPQGESATADVAVEVDGSDLAAGVPVELVRIEGSWKVTRGGVCAVLAIGSPCPST